MVKIQTDQVVCEHMCMRAAKFWQAFLASCGIKTSSSEFNISESIYSSVQMIPVDCKLLLVKSALNHVTRNKNTQSVCSSSSEVPLLLW